MYIHIVQTHHIHVQESTKMLWLSTIDVYATLPLGWERKVLVFYKRKEITGSFDRKYLTKIRFEIQALYIPFENSISVQHIQCIKPNRLKEKEQNMRSLTRDYLLFI